MGDLLVVEDDRDAASFLQASLEGRGHDVAVVHTVDAALSLVRQADCDLVIVDLTLPDGDGNDIIREVRAAGDVPVIVVSSRHDAHERVAAFEAGADDYVTKPFSVDELAARVVVQLRRAPPAVPLSQVLCFEGGLTIDLDHSSVRQAGTEVHLTPTELKMLAHLARRANTLVTHRELYAQAWPESGGGTDHYVRVFIQQIRKKLGDDPRHPTCIVTVPGRGYRWLLSPVSR